MRLRIHRGAHEIGGSCVEVESAGERLLLDLGLPLQGETRLPEVAGLSGEADPNLLGVVLSHAHLDHYGLLPQARSDLPVWLGAAAGRILQAAAPFTGGAAFPQAVHTYGDRAAFQVGRFQITPFLMDHSAFDAYALLVEADERRLFYSGDFRGHGRKARTFERFLADPPTNIDVLLMEGTTVTRQEPPVSEADVENQGVEIMRGTGGLVLAAFSGQNIDRFVTLLRAATRAGRTFVADAYMAALIRAAAMRRLPDLLGHPNVRIFLPAAQKRMIVRERAFALIEPYRAQRIYARELCAHPERHVMMFRASMANEAARLSLQGGALIYALWPGNLTRDRIDLRAFVQAHGMAFHLLHSSGHADVEDLRRLAQSVAPRRLIPIHTEAPDAVGRLHRSYVAVGDGEWVDV